MIQRIADNDRSAHGISKAYYVIDPTQAERQQRDMSALLLSRRCPACVRAGVERQEAAHGEEAD